MVTENTNPRDLHEHQPKGEQQNLAKLLASTLHKTYEQKWRTINTTVEGLPENVARLYLQDMLCTALTILEKNTTQERRRDQ